MINYPLYCPKCKQERLIEVKDLHITVVAETAGSQDKQKHIEEKDMIRPLEEKDIEIVCSIVNENWKNVYAGYVNPLLLSSDGCAERIRRLKSDFATNRLSEFVWEEENQVSAMLSIGDTADTDITGAFEIWRIYVAAPFQHNGIGRRLLGFAERQAKQWGYKKAVIWAFKDNAYAVSFIKSRDIVLIKRNIWESLILQWEYA